MSIHPAILISFSGCGILLFLVLFEHKLLTFLKRGMLGCIGIAIADYFLPVSLTLGFEWWTILIACLGGIPGVVLLYLYKFISNFSTL